MNLRHAILRLRSVAARGSYFVARRPIFGVLPMMSRYHKQSMNICFYSPTKYCTSKKSQSFSLNAEPGRLNHYRLEGSASRLT